MGEVLAIHLDVYRNRMVRMSMHLSIATLSLTSSMTVAGFLGMNLEIPAAFPSFWPTVGGALILAILVQSLCGVLVSNRRFQNLAQERVDEMNALQSIFEDMGRID